MANKVSQALRRKIRHRAKSYGIDPESGNLTVLFDPRNHHWNEHFRWDKEGAILIGLSDIGRATIDTLRMNRPLSIAVRRIWIAVHRHPPTEL